MIIIDLNYLDILELFWQADMNVMSAMFHDSSTKCLQSMNKNEPIYHNLNCKLSILSLRWARLIGKKIYALGPTGCPNLSDSKEAFRDTLTDMYNTNSLQHNSRSNQNIGLGIPRQIIVSCAATCSV